MLRGELLLHTHVRLVGATTSMRHAGCGTGGGTTPRGRRGARHRYASTARGLRPARGPHTEWRRRLSTGEQRASSRHVGGQGAGQRHCISWAWASANAVGQKSLCEGAGALNSGHPRVWYSRMPAPRIASHAPAALAAGGIGHDAYRRGEDEADWQGGHSVRSTIRRGVGATGGGMLDRSSLMTHT